MMIKLKSIISAMVTPFDENGEIIKDSIIKHVDFLIEKS